MRIKPILTFSRSESVILFPAHVATTQAGGLCDVSGRGYLSNYVLCEPGLSGTLSAWEYSSVVGNRGKGIFKNGIINS